MQTYCNSSPYEVPKPCLYHKQNFSAYLSSSKQRMNNITTMLRKLFEHDCRLYNAQYLWHVAIRGTWLPTVISGGIPLRWPVNLSLVSSISLQNRVSSFLEVAVRGRRSNVLHIIKYRFRTKLKQYRYAPRNDFSVNDGPHIRRRSQNIIILLKKR